MTFQRTLRTVAFASALAATAIAGPAAADDQGPRWWEPAVQQMATKDGMVSKREFMRMMEHKFDQMDKQKKGMLSAEDVKRIFRDDTGS